MIAIYSFFVNIISAILPLFTPFSKKLSLFVSGRKNSLSIIKQKISPSQKVFWLHASSLGEFEQGLPIITAFKDANPNYQIVVSFFSPSGYEIRKNHPLASAVVYLPLDSFSNMIPFINALNPSIAVFVKYEIWPVTMHILKQKNVPTFLISAIFNPSQAYFKPYGFLLKNALASFTHILTQDENSLKLLASININNASLSGDTRFDRVSQIKLNNNALPFMEEFLQGSPCFVFGSSWPEDEQIYLPFINSYSGDFKFVIAPHNINPEHIQNLKSQISKSITLFSQKDTHSLQTSQVLILDTIGILTKVYSYASIAYVGGAMKTGLHNILEPAVFSIPIIIGKNYSKFLEAQDLVALTGVTSISTKEEFEAIATTLVTSPQKRKSLGQINSSYIERKKGATITTLSLISKYL